MDTTSTPGKTWRIDRPITISADDVTPAGLQRLIDEIAAAEAAGRPEREILALKTRLEAAIKVSRS
jgi:hypothetical protein